MYLASPNCNNHKLQHQLGFKPPSAPPLLRKSLSLRLPKSCLAHEGSRASYQSCLQLSPGRRHWATAPAIQRRGFPPKYYHHTCNTCVLTSFSVYFCFSLNALAARNSVGRSPSLMLMLPASLLAADWLREISPGQLSCGTAEAFPSEGSAGSCCSLASGIPEYLSLLSWGLISSQDSAAGAAAAGAAAAGAAAAGAAAICFLNPRRQPRLPLKSSGRARYCDAPEPHAQNLSKQQVWTSCSQSTTVQTGRRHALQLWQQRLTSCFEPQSCMGSTSRASRKNPRQGSTTRF